MPRKTFSSSEKDSQKIINNPTLLWAELLATPVSSHLANDVEGGDERWFEALLMG
jgi:hypothetical protein